MFVTSLQTQWNISMSGIRIGLNYPSIESVLNLRNIRQNSKREQLFYQIQLLERGFLKQERSNREAKS